MDEAQDFEPDWSEVFAGQRDDNGVQIDPFVPLQDDEQLVRVRLIDLEAAEIRRGRRLLKLPAGSHTGPERSPTPSEIKLMCMAIQSEWSPREMRDRQCGRDRGHVEVRSGRVGQ